MNFPVLHFILIEGYWDSPSDCCSIIASHIFLAEKEAAI
jgi:hypothetical protein